MPEKEMAQVKVYTSKDGHIIITQQAFGSDDQLIALHPEQIDVLVKWLKEAKEELEQS